jgi:hypothetical protein
MTRIGNSRLRWQGFSNLHHRRYRNRFKVHSRPSHIDLLLPHIETLAAGKAYGLYLLGTGSCGLSALKRAGST